MKIKLVVRPGILALRFNENPFLSIILGLRYSWIYKHYNEYISQKKVISGTTNKIHLKCDPIDSSVVNGLRQPKLYSFVLDERPG